MQHFHGCFLKRVAMNYEVVKSVFRILIEDGEYKADLYSDL